MISMSLTTNCSYTFSFLILSLNYCPSSFVRAESNFGNLDTNTNANPIYFGIALAGLTLLFILAFLGFNFCFKSSSDTSPRGGWQGPPGWAGLDRSIIMTFPVFTYSDVSGHRPDEGPLECAVCLGEFEEAETLRLLPKCNHIFHVSCVDTWLADNSTCPLCRTNLVPQPGELARENEGRVGGPADEAVNVVGVEPVEVRQGVVEGHFRKFRRWSSTGQLGLEEGWERYTLRLPEEVKKDMVTAKINRSNSCRQFCIEVG